MRNIDHLNNYESNKQKLWEQSEQLQFIKDLKEGITIEKAIKRIDYKKAFVASPLEMGCSDGRCPGHRFGGAGNFILAPDVEIEEFIKRNKNRIMEVKSHEGCGAAAIKFKQMVKDGQSLPCGVKTSDDLGKFFSQNLAEKLGAMHNHTRKSEMLGDIHNERVIYFDGTGKFNRMALPELPDGFICSGSSLGFSDKYMENELSELSNIAFQHGFEDKFDNDNPFYFVIFASDKKQLNQMKQIAEKVAEKFHGRIVIGGFEVK